MKKLTLIYLVYKNPLTGSLYFLSGVKARNTKMAGIRNGYGGKVEETESPDECAMRELLEESENSFGELSKDKLRRVGEFIQDDKIICVYIYNLDEMTTPRDDREFVNFVWEKFGDVSRLSTDEMLPGDEFLLSKIHQAVLINTEFKFDKKDILSENDEALIKERTRGIFR